ncbi:distal tail protein Dit [Paucilactobacillus kaifaensis]|uniref:distal tail protein Dit n=1 Tax=Paucilactobacillus kaifaensis TaxID=2559921 RepID=UPI0010F937D9|nr:distal tail protein Dit [Paucilactobacillus kaifaensis]
MSKLQVWFDGIEITQYLQVKMGKDEMLLPERTDDVLSPGNMIGSRLRSSKVVKRTIEMPFIMTGDLRNKTDKLKEALYVTEPKKLIMSDRMDRYYLAIPDGSISLPESDSVDWSGTIKWLCYDPYAYDMREDEFEFSDTAQTVSLSLDYRTKIQGDLDSNPNTIYGAEWHAIENRAPDSFWWEWEQYNYNQVQMLDGITGSYQRTQLENSTRLMMKFNVLESINNSYPGIWQRYGIIDVADKIAWLKANLTKFTFNVWSYGQGASGYGVRVQYWNGTEWTGTQVNTASSPSKNSYTFTAAEVASYLDADGYFYALSGTNDTDANTASTMYLDYTNIDVTLTLPVSDALVVTNDGPLPVPIRFELTNHGDNGFFGITNDTESILLGKTNDVDGGIVENSERLFTTKQDNSIGLSQWTINDGVLNNLNETPVQAGKFHPPYEKRWRLRNNGGYDYWGNSASNNRGWHGPTIYTEFGVDSKGATGAVNFTSRAYVNIMSTNIKQGGLTQVNISGSDREFIAGVQLWKPNNGHGGIKIRIGKHWAYIDENNARWDRFFGSIQIDRHGNTYTITVQDIEGGTGAKQTITFDDPDSAKIVANGFTYWKAMWGNKINDISWQDFYDFWFQKDNVENYVDIPNTFNDGDSVVIDNDQGAVETSVNGSLFLGMQEIGSKSVMAYQGTNMISFMYSDFANRPDVKAYIRKRYL